MARLQIAGMTDLFSSEGQKTLRQFVRPRMLCLFDFDGTLVPLVADPAKALLSHPIQSRLVRLQARAQVGIVTGRSLSDICSRLEFVPDYLVGNHGLEGLPGWQQRADEFYAICRCWYDQLAPELAAIDTGISLEDKHYSLSLHFRHAQDKEAVMKTLPTLLAELTPSPRVIGGKCVFNLLPTHGGDKGHAVTQLISETGAQRTLYVGDDVTDEDVFAIRRDDLMSVRVGCIDEVSVQSAATHCIASAGHIAALLDCLIALLAAEMQQPMEYHQIN